MNNKRFATRIRDIRKAKGITATFVARKLGYKNVSSYTRLEKGEITITLERAKQIADLLQVDINEFFYDQNLRDSRKMEFERQELVV